jgi:cytoskeletal protein CcmA (bactofilin family)
VNRKDDLTGFLDRGVKFTGELEFENTFRIDGSFHGKIRSQDLLVVGDNGTVEAEIDVGTISVNGTVRGTIRAKQRIEILKSGKIFADVVTPSLHIEEGGVLQGKCEMDMKGRAELRPEEWKARKESQ